MPGQDRYVGCQLVFRQDTVASKLSGRLTDEFQVASGTVPSTVPGTVCQVDGLMKYQLLCRIQSWLE
jgi:hypothetical protein